MVTKYDFRRRQRESLRLRKAEEDEAAIGKTRKKGGRQYSGLGINEYYLGGGNWGSLKELKALKGKPAADQSKKKDIKAFLDEHWTDRTKPPNTDFWPGGKTGDDALKIAQGLYKDFEKEQKEIGTTKLDDKYKHSKKAGFVYHIPKGSNEVTFNDNLEYTSRGDFQSTRRGGQILTPEATIDLLNKQNKLKKREEVGSSQTDNDTIVEREVAAAGGTLTALQEKQRNRHGMPGSTTKEQARVRSEELQEIKEAYAKEREGWLNKTANSPAADAGFSKEDRWQLQIKHRKWQAEHGRSSRDALKLDTIEAFEKESDKVT